VGTIAIDFGAPLTITTTAQQNTFLSRVLVRINNQGAAQVPPLPARTMEQFIRDVVVASIQQYRDVAVQNDTVDAKIAFGNLTQTQQNQIVTLLGGNNPFV